MIEQNTHTTHYATVWCDHDGCRKCECVRDHETLEHALEMLHTRAIANDWTIDGDKAYCCYHAPVVIDPNQMELLP